MKKNQPFIIRNHFPGRLMCLLYGHYLWGYRDYEERDRERNPLKNKSIHRIVEEAKEGHYKE